MGHSRSRPHTEAEAGDVDVADGELRFFRRNLRICVSRAGQELSIELLLSEIGRLNSEKRPVTSLVTFSPCASHLGQGLSPLPDNR